MLHSLRRHPRRCPLTILARRFRQKMINLSDRATQPPDYVADARLFVTLFFETARATVFRIARRCSPPSDSSPISPGPHAAPRPPNPFPGVVRHQRRGTIAGRVL